MITNIELLKVAWFILVLSIVCRGINYIWPT